MKRVYEKKEIDELFKTYFWFVQGKHYLVNAVKELAKGQGYGIEDVCCTLPSDYNEWEEGYFGKNGVKINIYAPAYNYDVYAVVTEEEFLNYLKTEVEKFIESNPEYSEEINYYFKILEKNLMSNKK